MGSLTLWKERLKVVAAVMGCREAWALPPWMARAFLKSVRSTRPVAAPTGIFLCPNVPPVGTVSYRRYLNGLKRLCLGEHVPLAAHVSVTDRCGYRCARCSNVSRVQSDPSLGLLLQLIVDLKAAGVASVAFTGGEPLLRDDLAHLVAACGEELSATVLTSGQRLDAGSARKLRAVGLAAVHVSLDHFVPEEHDRVRGTTGAFAQALRAIEACLQAGLYTAVQAVAEPLLLQDGQLERFLRFCRGLGVHEVVLLEPLPIQRNAPCAPFDQATKDRLSAWHLRAAADPALPKVTASAFLEGPEFQGCQAGYSFLYVNTNGDVFPCDLAPISLGNAHTEGLSKVLARLARHFRRPARACFALRMLALSRDGAVPRASWPEAEHLMAFYDPGEPPGLMKGLTTPHARHGRRG